MAGDYGAPGQCVLDRANAAFSDRADYDTLWQTISNYVIPRKSTFTEQLPAGAKRERYVLDSTAPRSLELFAAFLHAALSSPASDWIQVTASNNPDVMQRDAMQRWAEATKKKMKAEVSLGVFNAYTAFHESYLDDGAFGTSCLFVDEDTKKHRVRTRNFHLRSIAFDLGPDGRVDTVYHREEMTINAAKKRWGDKLPQRMQDAVKDVLRSKECFTHCVFPANDPELNHLIPEYNKMAAGQAAFYAVWITSQGEVISSGHYEEMPYIISRWSLASGEKYGRSPAMTVLGDILMVNRMSETMLRGAEKLVDPPWVIPDGAIMSPIRMFPGGITYTDGDVQPHPLVPPGASRIELGDALIKERQQAIREGFFVPLFITPESPVKTATQVLQEVDERNKAVTPMIVRQQAEKMDPYVARVFGIMLRAGRLTPPPLEAGDGSIVISFVSPILSAQDQVAALAVARLYEGLAPWASVAPEIFDNIEIDAVPGIIHKGAGAPLALLAKSTAVKKRRDDRAARETAAAQSEQTTAALEASAKLQAAQRV